MEHQNHHTTLTNGAISSEAGFRWIKEGLLFGILMFIIMQLILPYINGDDITQASLLIAVPVWLFAGIFYGLTIRYLRNRLKS